MRSDIKHVVRGISLVTVFVLGIFFVSGCIGQEEEVVAEHPLDGQTIEVGVIHASSITEGERIATEIAFEEANAYAETLGIDVEFVPLFEASEGRTALVVEKFDTLLARGVKFVLGLWWSSSCRAILEKANENKVVLFSGASTAPDLAIANDFLFRMVVSDEGQGAGIATMMESYGIEACVVSQRADTWADGLFDEFEKNWDHTVVDRVRYDPEKTDFSADVKVLNDLVVGAKAQYGADKTAVLHLGFTVDSTAITISAGEYPDLLDTLWFGSDGHAYTAEYMQSEGIRDLAIQMRHICTLMGVTKSSNFFNFAEKYTPRYGAPPGTYETLQYDCAWVLAKTILESASTDTEIIRQALPTVAAQYYGASGWCKLNEKGDRGAGAFDVWAVIAPGESQNPDALFPDPNMIGWELVANYDPDADVITWNRAIPL